MCEIAISLSDGCLRSRGDGPDVAAIAELAGGGGHRNASGLFLPAQITMKRIPPVDVGDDHG